MRRPVLRGQATTAWCQRRGELTTPTPVPLAAPDRLAELRLEAVLNCNGFRRDALADQRLDIRLRRAHACPLPLRGAAA
jgi:hypothetical protein